MDWQVKSASSLSDVSGRTFKRGERIVSFLLRDENGELRRSDVSEEESHEHRPMGTVLARWEQEKREKISETDAKRQSLQNSLGLFLSLFEVDEEGMEERKVLKYLLALMLERKRILKPTGFKQGERIQCYEMKDPKGSFEVSVVDVTAESVARIEGQLRNCV